MPEVRRLSSTRVTRLRQYYAPVRLPCTPPATQAFRLRALTTRVSHVTRITFLACCLHYPGGPGRCACWLLPCRYKPSPALRRAGIRIKSFEACSEFTRVTARQVARPPKAAFVTGLRSGQLPGQTACQLPELTNYSPGETSIH